MSKFTFLHKIIATIVFATLIASSTLDAAMGQPRHRGGCCAAFARLTATLSRAQSATTQRARTIVKNVFHRILGSQPSTIRINTIAAIATTAVGLAGGGGGMVITDSTIGATCGALIALEYATKGHSAQSFTHFTFDVLCEHLPHVLFFLYCMELIGPENFIFFFTEILGHKISSVDLEYINLMKNKTFIYYVHMLLAVLPSHAFSIALDCFDTLKKQILCECFCQKKIDKSHPQLRKLLFGKFNTDSSCSICYQPLYREGSDVAELNFCKHRFDLACINRVITETQNPQCPFQCVQSPCCRIKEINEHDVSTVVPFNLEIARRIALEEDAE